MSTHKRYHRNSRKTAKLIPKPLSQYFPKCARANQNIRIDLISHGSAYAFGSIDQEKSGKYALWAFVMAAFNESLNGWIKEELLSDFGLEHEHRWTNIIRILNEYVKFYNEQRPCFAVGYDTPENYRKRYYKGELPRKNTFETRDPSPEPKFVRERREKSDNKEDK